MMGYNIEMEGSKTKNKATKQFEALGHFEFKVTCLRPNSNCCMNEGEIQKMESQIHEQLLAMSRTIVNWQNQFKISIMKMECGSTISLSS